MPLRDSARGKGAARDWQQRARTFGDQVQQARTERNLTLWQLAEQCQLSPRTLKDIERGRPVEPRAIESVGRTLCLAAPKLEGDPVHTFALLIRRRREQARLKMYQLAALSGLSLKVLKEVEQAIYAPTPETCIALLSVTALHLKTDDIAPFVADLYTASDLAEQIRRITQERIRIAPKLIGRTLRPDSYEDERNEDELNEDDLNAFDLSEGDLAADAPAPAAPETGLTKPKPRLLFTLRVYVDGSLLFTPALKNSRP